MGRIERLLGRQDVHGLIKRLDKKDGGSASIALRVLGPAAVPALIDALETKKAAAATSVLIDIGTPALPQLLDALWANPHGVGAPVGVAIAGIRKRHGLPDDVILRLQTLAYMSKPDMASHRRTVLGGPGPDKLAPKELDEMEANNTAMFLAATNALGESLLQEGLVPTEA